MSAEPSMEEILSSIKRIIAEEGESPIRGRRVGRATPPPPPAHEDGDEDEVLELSHPIGEPTPLPDRPVAVAPVANTAEPEPEPVAPPPPVVSPVAAAPAAIPAALPEPPVPPSASPSTPAPDPADPILSTQAAAASRHSLDSLSRLMVKPGSGGDNTLEGLVREMLRPMLRDWLDANLPAMVETMVQAEIARISTQS